MLPLMRACPGGKALRLAQAGAPSRSYEAELRRANEGNSKYNHEYEWMTVGSELA